MAKNDYYCIWPASQMLLLHLVLWDQVIAQLGSPVLRNRTSPRPESERGVRRVWARLCLTPSTLPFAAP
jgi:hypothetical protein